MKRSYDDIRIQAYLLQSEITVDDHQRRLILSLNRDLDGKTPVYLDLNYWITLRDTAAGRGDRCNSDLLAAVRNARETCFFPIGPTIFTEILKQGDHQKRLEWAALVDELSGGVTARNDIERAHEELSYQFLSMNGKIPISRPSQSVWTRIGHVLGAPRSAQPRMPDQLLAAANKTIIDDLWAMSAVEWVSETKDMPFSGDMTALADKLNRMNAEAPRPRSYQDAYNQESGGVVDLYAEQIVDIIEPVIKSAGIDSPPRSHPAFRFIVQQAERALALGLRKKDVRLNLPTISIPAALFASVWWDSQRKIKPNDVFDFQHAATALPYCEAFLTEGPLRTLIVQSPDKLDEMYGCRVISEQDTAIEYLNQLGPDPQP